MEEFGWSRQSGLYVVGAIIAVLLCAYFLNSETTPPKSSGGNAESVSVASRPAWPALASVDGPFGLKFGATFSGVEAREIAGACGLGGRGLERSILAELEQSKNDLTFKELNTSVGPTEVTICEIGLNGRLAFAYVPFGGATEDAKKILWKLTDEFDRRYGRVKPRFFRFTEAGAFSGKSYMVAVMRFFWKKPPLFVELVAPFTVGPVNRTFSESYSYVLYIDSRQLKDLRAMELKAQQLENEKDRRSEEELGKATKHF